MQLYLHLPAYLYSFSWDKTRLTKMGQVLLVEIQLQKVWLLCKIGNVSFPHYNLKEMPSVSH